MSPAPNRPERSSPFSVRFTDSERARLRALAGGQPLGRYIRERALAGDVEPRRVRQEPVQDGQVLGQLLGLLGQSRLASNLNQLAKAAHQGSLPVTQEVEAELRAACTAVQEMRALLLRALGLRVVETVLAGAASEAFARESGQ